jgi:hypothetical protein
MNWAGPEAEGHGASGRIDIDCGEDIHAPRPHMKMMHVGSFRALASAAKSHRPPEQRTLWTRWRLTGSSSREFSLIPVPPDVLL